MQFLGVWEWCRGNVFFLYQAVKRVRLWAVLREYIFYNVELRFVKWVMFLERNCIVKWVIYFASFFFWLWCFLLVNLKSKDKIQIWSFESFTFWSKFHFFGSVLRRFSQCNFKFFVVNQPWWPTFLLSPRTMKSLPTVLVINT